MADSFLFNINSTLPDLDELLQHCLAAYTAYIAFTAPVRKPSDHQSNPIEFFDTPLPLYQVTPATWHEVSQASLTLSWLRRP